MHKFEIFGLNLHLSLKVITGSTSDALSVKPQLLPMNSVVPAVTSHGSTLQTTSTRVIAKNVLGCCVARFSDHSFLDLFSLCIQVRDGQKLVKELKGTREAAVIVPRGCLQSDSMTEKCTGAMTPCFSYMQHLYLSFLVASRGHQPTPDTWPRTCTTSANRSKFKDLYFCYPL